MLNFNCFLTKKKHDLERDPDEMQPELQYRTKLKTEEAIKPFLKTDFGELYNYDAIKYLKQLDSNSIDLIFADPPYNINKPEWDSFSSQKEYVEWSMEWITEAQRVLKQNGT